MCFLVCVCFQLCRYTWLGDAAGEVATLSFYLMTGVKFQPAQHNPYLSLEEAEMAEL